MVFRECDVDGDGTCIMEAIKLHKTHTYIYNANLSAYRIEDLCHEDYPKKIVQSSLANNYRFFFNLFLKCKFGYSGE